jgi:hypothetical protein
MQSPIEKFLQLSDNEKGRIVTFHQTSKSVKEIAV